MRADLLFTLGDAAAAKSSIDAAYGLGETGPKWLELALAVHMALDERPAVASLLQAMQRQVPEAAATAILRAAFARVQAPAAQESDGVEDAQPSQTPETQQQAEAMSPSGTDGGSAPADEVDVPAHRRALHDGQVSHIQLRMSHVDGSFAIDYYARPGRAKFAQEFQAGYAQVRAYVDPMGLSERRARYRFARCTHCTFDVLTCRDEDENFLCQACGERGPVRTIEEAALGGLAVDCERAIGREQAVAATAPVATVLVVALWLRPEMPADAVARSMEDAGFSPVAADGAAGVALWSEMRKRGLSLEGRPTQLWSRPVSGAEWSAANDTPAALDRILRELRRSHGPVVSGSMEIPQEMLGPLVGTQEDRLTWIRMQCQERPADLGILQLLVDAELQAGYLDAAKGAVSRMQLLDPLSPMTVLAQASLDFARGDHERAALIAEHVLEQEPRSLAARSLAFRARRAAGDEAAARRHASELGMLAGALS